MHISIHPDLHYRFGVVAVVAKVTAAQDTPGGGVA